MSWFLAAIGARFFWSTCTLFDQYISRVTGNKSAVAILMLEFIAAAPITLCLSLLIDHPLTLQPSSYPLMAIAVITNGCALAPYFLLLRQDDAQNVAPFFELTAVFVTLFSYLFFGDTLAPIQAFGALLIVVCSALMAWDFKRARIKKRTLLLSLAATLLWASSQVALRSVSPVESTWKIAFFFGLAHTLSTPFLLAFFPEARKILFDCLKKTKGLVFIPAFGEEFALLLGSLCIITAFSKAPGAGYVAALSGVQPVFVMITSLILGSMGVKYFSRLVWNFEMKIKCALLTCIVTGVYLLSLA